MARRLAENHPTGAQLRAARGLLNMSLSELSEITSMSLNTIKRAEASDGLAPVSAVSAARLVTSLEAHGIEFLPEDAGRGPGVRISKMDQAPERQAKRRRARVGN